ncbi:MAG: glycosyltransferase family 2 protein [Bradyrhizobium sp.]|uniref:glycosyltransferase family A protein n=1 Tax=Bradyrhizobium sp. TaxID=376 RepID=UPI001C28BEDC|nr:glycosyltransferase family A protein [Bradyrhizobium sp.]MBU6461130.1 glycosyltransferase family 2 protein [Pseudomonadota bacterium]MDE2066206.1 glycosyltransferase family 2 protein [Bradyrhizobium sp.]MDE2472646.1 glycosyltransferase family 2 protein [Bradyrhizobium sp.]
MATIEVLLPVKNALPFLAESIESVCSQTFRDWRLLILDHGSTDGSTELALKYAERDKRIVVHVNPDAPDLGGLLNFGLGKADGRFIVRQDGDDVSLQTRFQTVVDVFSADPDLIVMGGQASMIDASGRDIGYISRPLSPAAIVAASFFYIPVVHPAAAFNHSRLASLGALYGNDILNVLPPEKSVKVLSLAEDYFLFGQLALLGKCRNVAAPLIKHRIHDNSVSVANRVAQNACALSISRFLAMSFAEMKGTAVFDPAPFCSHAENVFDCGREDYSPEFDRMARSLEEGLGQSQELTRELAFRRVLAKRDSVTMAGRYASFVLRNGLRAPEYRLLRNWLARFINDKYVTRVEDGLTLES